MKKAHKEKATKYQSLVEERRARGWQTWRFPVEIGCGAFPAKSTWQLLSALWPGWRERGGGGGSKINCYGQWFGPHWGPTSCCVMVEGLKTKWRLGIPEDMAHGTKLRLPQAENAPQQAYDASSGPWMQLYAGTHWRGWKITMCIHKYCISVQFWRTCTSLEWFHSMLLHATLLTILCFILFFSPRFSH